MKYAFIDEFGAFGRKFDNPGCSTHFIITAVIADDSDLPLLDKNIERIRGKYFQTGEMKSKTINKNHKKRVEILKELKNLPFKVFVFVCDKRRIYENSGLTYKKTFYKFLNNLVYEELRTAFRQLKIVADEVGGNEYLASFAKYVRDKEVPLSLFDQHEFKFSDSKGALLVQVADIISGSLAYHYDEHKKKKAEGFNYLSLLREKILRIEMFPRSFDEFCIPDVNGDPDYDAEIAEICYRRAASFIKSNPENCDENVKQQIAVLNYLLFRFMNNTPKRYISTKELINQLTFLGYERLSVQTFRNKIIARLRDKGVIISSSKHGYKLPTSELELYNFVNHGKNIIMPMLSRLKICNEAIKLGTLGKIDLFRRAEYQALATMLTDLEK